MQINRDPSHQGSVKFKILALLIVSMAFFSTFSAKLAVQSDEDPSEVTLEELLISNSETNSLPRLRDFINITVLPINVSDYANISSMIEAFLLGSDFDARVSTNASTCINNLLFFYYFQLPSLPFKYYYGDMNDDIYNTSILITNASLSLLECTQVAIDAYTYVFDYGEQFNNSYTTYSLAFF